MGWWAVASDIRLAARQWGGGPIPRGALVRYREWYGAQGASNAGLRLAAEAVAAGIREREEGEKMRLCRVPIDLFAEAGGPSIAERLRRSGVFFRPADNTRVGKLGAVSGWDQMRARIAGTEEGPMLVVFSSCRDFLRTVPALGHDPARPEDLDTAAEDHIADETRYACLSRPLAAPAPKPAAAGPSGWDWERMRREEANCWRTA